MVDFENEMALKPADRAWYKEAFKDNYYISKEMIKSSGFELKITCKKAFL
jgi:hypothetical protein